MKPLRVFVTATDTGVGKTQVSCALLRALESAGLQPSALKPYESGGNEDARRLREAAGSRQLLRDTVVHQLKAPLAPAMAARLEKKKTSFVDVTRAFRRLDGRSLVVEGAGGLFVPVDDRRDIIDVMAAFKLPALLVARAGLGTLNHVALSLAALSVRKIPVLAVVLVKSTPSAELSERFNAAFIAKRHGVTTIGPVPFVADERARAKAFDRALTKWLRGR